MAVNFRYEDADKLKGLLDELKDAPPQAATRYLKRAALVVRDKVIANLGRSNIGDPDYVHLKDDVRTRKVKDKFGYDVMRISGSKKTGSKWHLVNDGTYKTAATHFMDNALNASDGEIEAIFDEEMKRSGFDG